MRWNVENISDNDGDNNDRDEESVVVTYIFENDDDGDDDASKDQTKHEINYGNSIFYIAYYLLVKTRSK